MARIPMHFSSGSSSSACSATAVLNLLLAAATVVVAGGADNSQYLYGDSRDSVNILQDLSSYDKLYVTYHNCAWSPYEDGDGDGGECGEETDDQYWYMGATACFRANAAYSLYGVYKGEEDLGCDRTTFINSFFTTSGVEAFTQSVSAAGVAFQSGNNGNDEDNDYPGGVTAICSADENNNNNNNGDDYYQHNSKYNSGSTSYGVGCSTDRKFMVMTYKGPFCDVDEQIKVTDELSRFNNDISQASCLQIYDGTNSNGDDGEDNGGGDDDGDALGMLYYSQACRVREFPKSCPDPHGTLKALARAEERAVAKAENPQREHLKFIFTWVLLGLGLLLIAIAICVYMRRSRISQKRREQWEHQHRGSRKRIFGVGVGGGGGGGSFSSKPNSTTSRSESSRKSSIRSFRQDDGGEANQQKQQQPRKGWRKLFGRNK